MTNAEMQKLNESVQLCVRHSALNNLCNRLQYNLNRTFLSDEEYIENYVQQKWKDLGGFWTKLWLYVFWFAIAQALLGLLLGKYFNPDFGPVINWIVELSVMIGVAVLLRKAYFKLSRSECLESTGYLTNKKDREDIEPNRENIANTLNEKRAELQALEEMMEDRSVCIIPKKYWGIAPQLLGLINDCRASSLQEAINLYHQLQREDARDKKIQLQLEYARDAYEAADRAADIAEQARRSAESAEQTAKDIDSYNRYGF